MTIRLHRLALPAAVGLLALAGCADQDQTSAAAPAAAAGDQQEYEVAATVLENPEHGPQLCQTVAESFPPQCSGPDLVGWDWAQVEAESEAGVTWGEYLLVGTWDGSRFTLTEPPQPADGTHTPAEPDFTSPCPEPAGGWQPVDLATATQPALDAALARASETSDYAGAWVDQSYLDALDESEREQAGNDPARLVLNLRFTGAIEAREQSIREVWGGALCVTQAERTEAELLDIQQRLHEELPEVQGSHVSEVENAVVAEVFVADPTLQRDMDQQFGAGAVILQGWLQPRS